MRTLIIAVASLILASSEAFAQPPIPTAAPMDAAPPGAGETGAPAALDEAHEMSQFAAGANFCGGPARLPDGSNAAAAEQIHGEVGAALGSRGSHEVHLAACKPIGDRGGLAIDVEQSQFSSGRRSH